jgi:hypothetical protein
VPGSGLQTRLFFRPSPVPDIFLSGEFFFPVPQLSVLENQLPDNCSLQVGNS